MTPRHYYHNSDPANMIQENSPNAKNPRPTASGLLSRLLSKLTPDETKSIAYSLVQNSYNFGV